jgi:hypothetical protein
MGYDLLAATLIYDGHYVLSDAIWKFYTTLNYSLLIYINFKMTLMWWRAMEPNTFPYIISYSLYYPVRVRANRLCYWVPNLVPQGAVNADKLQHLSHRRGRISY